MLSCVVKARLCYFFCVVTLNRIVLNNATKSRLNFKIVSDFTGPSRPLFEAIEYARF